MNPYVGNAHRDQQIAQIDTWLQNDNVRRVEEFHRQLGNYLQWWGGYAVEDPRRPPFMVPPPRLRRLNVERYKQLWDEGGNTGKLMVGREEEQGIFTDTVYVMPPIYGNPLDPRNRVPLQQGQPPPGKPEPPKVISILGAQMFGRYYAVGYGDNAPKDHIHIASDGTKFLKRVEDDGNPFTPETIAYERQ